MASSHPHIDSVVTRLEKAVASFESLISSTVHSFTSASSSSSAAPSSSSSSSSSRQAQEWQALENNELAAFIKASSSNASTSALAQSVRIAFNRVGDVVRASSTCAKPSDSDLMTFLQPLISVLEKTQQCDNRSPYYNHQKAVAEGLQGCTWITIAPPNGSPKDMAQSGVEQADFYLIKILSDAKKNYAGKPEAEEFTNFASSWKLLLQKQTQFVAEFYRMGLDWNPKGTPLSTWSSSSSSSSSAPTANGSSSSAVPPPPPSAPDAPSFTTQASKAASAVAGGMGAVFGQLSSLGDGVTGGLKKVTADMKTKNRPKDDVAPEIPIKSSSASSSSSSKPSSSALAVKKEAKTYQAKGTWFVENYTSGSVKINEIELKESVYILNCTGVSVEVPKKCKSIQVDSCKKINVDFSSVVSTFEVVNSERVHIYVNQGVPSVTLDKSDGISLHLVTREAAFKFPPQIVTSKISECNIVVPGASDEDDPIETPLPEQFITILQIESTNAEAKGAKMKLKTEAVAHSAN